MIFAGMARHIGVLPRAVRSRRGLFVFVPPSQNVK